MTIIVNLLLTSYGIEGVTYEKTNDTQVKYIQGGGYSPASNWAFGNTFIAYTLDGQPKDAIEITKNLNDTGRSSAILGFSFNSEPVKSELASVAKVVEEYCQVIAGEMPVDETITALNEKLKIAGVDNIVAEMQRQIDEFLLTK